MASTTALAHDFLLKLEADLKVVNTPTTGTNASIYNFAGYRNGQAVGISRTATLGLNRGGQILQFLAGYFTQTTDVSIKNRIGKASAEVYNVFNSRPVFSNGVLYSDAKNFETTGQFDTAPSSSLIFLGLMMIDKQGVIDNVEFARHCSDSASFIRNTQLPRQASKLNRALDNASSVTTELMRGGNHIWFTQKMATLAINGQTLALATMSLYNKLYKASTYVGRYAQSYTLNRYVATKWGTTYNSAGDEVNVTTPGASPGTKLCLAIGGNQQGRGAFPSIGYNGLVAMAMTLQAFAERTTSTSTFSSLKTAVENHPLQIDALKILNYYRDRIVADGATYELGAHRNFPGDASRIRGSWKTELMRQGLSAAGAESTLVGQAQFDYLLDKSNNPGMGGYSYTMMWVLSTHSVFNKLATAYSPNSGKSSLDIDYSKVGNSASVAQAFAATGEAAACRVVSGLGIALIQGVTTIN